MKDQKRINAINRIREDAYMVIAGICINGIMLGETNGKITNSLVKYQRHEIDKIIDRIIKVVEKSKS